MDNLNSEKVKKIICKRSVSSLQDSDEVVDPNKCNKSRSDSFHLSTYQETCEPAQPYALPIIPTLKVQEWCSNTSIILSGTALAGTTGPPVGVVDVGISKYAYYFCVAVPGVKQDPGEFSCEIQRDGKVCIRGVTSTGGKIVKKHSREFEMKFQQQCPPGPFTLTFCLPGPVDPRLISPTFRSDGIFEAVVAKCEQILVS